MPARHTFAPFPQFISARTHMAHMDGIAAAACTLSQLLHQPVAIDTDGWTSPDMEAFDAAMCTEGGRIVDAADPDHPDRLCYVGVDGGDPKVTLWVIYLD